MPTISERIIKSEQYPWEKFVFLQPQGFKELDKNNYEKFRSSVIENNIIRAFKAWERRDGSVVCLDGYHLCKILKILKTEGWVIPDKLATDFYSCDSEQDAAKLILAYSSVYAMNTEEGLYEFSHQFQLHPDQYKNQTSLPSIKFEQFEASFFNSDESEDKQGNQGKGGKPSIITCPECGAVFEK